MNRNWLTRQGAVGSVAGKKRCRQEGGEQAAAGAAEEENDVEEDDAVLLEVQLVYPEGRDPEQVKEDWKAFVHVSWRVGGSLCLGNEIRVARR